MANKKTRPVNKEELLQIIDTIRKGFRLPNGVAVRPNEKVANAILTETNLGLRIGDVLRLRLCDIVLEGDRYHLDIVEQKTGKRRTFTVPADFYIYLQNYALARGLKPTQRLFDLSTRAVQNHLHMVCDYLGLDNVGTHSFRKMFAVDLYTSSGYNVELVREILQHSSVAVTQHYLSVEPRAVQQALENHLILPT